MVHEARQQRGYNGRKCTDSDIVIPKSHEIFNRIEAWYKNSWTQWSRFIL
jgi:hypothetical protein